MDRIILDTDVASLSLKGRLPPSLPPRLVGRQVGITFVTLGELTQWVELRQWGPRQLLARPEGDGDRDGLTNHS